MRTYFVYNDEMDLYKGAIYFNSFRAEKTPRHLGYDTLKKAKDALKRAEQQSKNRPWKINVSLSAFTNWHIGEVYEVYHIIQ